MAVVDRWLLPDGVEEILPNQALKVERLRRRLLDLYHNWGYDFVIPPMIEFSESLLSGTGSDLDLLTFKVTDQLSGRMMGVRADITPQTARMDAHSLRLNGPCRLCYAATVLYTRPRSALQSRCPILVGVELYGEASLGADSEVINLMVETLRTAGLKSINLDLGHVGIYRALLELAELDATQERALFDLLQRKAIPELTAWLTENISDSNVSAMFRQLVELSGDENILDRAREVFADAPAELELALDELSEIVSQLKVAAPDAKLYLDLCELRGYHYHTGIVFAAYAPGLEQPIGNGGRYDHVGEAFGRSRPATGFNVNLKTLSELAYDQNQNSGNVSDDTTVGIYAPSEDDSRLAQTIADLRKSGERVVCGFVGQHPNFQELHCDRQLVLVDDQYQIKPVVNN